MGRFKNILFLIATILSACNKEETAPAKSFFYEYYPLQKAKVLIYDVDSTAYSDFTNTSTNYKFKLKDSVADVFKDLLGNDVYRVERYKKMNGSNTWVYQKTIARSLSIRAAQETLDNVTYTRLIFPPIVGAKWNGNSRNTLGEAIYEITDFPATTSIGNSQYDSTVVVLQADENNLIREDIASEVYAKNIGLIKKQVRAIDKDINTQKIKNGTIYSMTLQNP